MPAVKFTDEFRKWFFPHLWKEDEPVAQSDLKYDPHFGFEDRKPKKIKATLQEMDSIRLDPLLRDECAHVQLAYQDCMNNNTPLWWRCHGFSNELKLCAYEEKVHDMKEFERERRLNARERKLKEQGLA